MKEYADYSTRGKSELTISPDGSKKEIQKGLDKNYITQYSYAKLETFNLFVPRYMGGGTVETLGKSSDFYKLIKQTMLKILILQLLTFLHVKHTTTQSCAHGVRYKVHREERLDESARADELAHREEDAPHPACTHKRE